MGLCERVVKTFNPTKDNKNRPKRIGNHQLDGPAITGLSAGRPCLFFDNRKEQTIGISKDGRQLLTDATKLAPDVVVLDVGMPELNGIDAALQLSKLLPRTKMVFVTQQIDVQYLRAAFRAGGVGYVAKQSAAQELLTAIKRALDGGIYVTPLLKDAIPNLSLRELRQNSDVFAKELTPRQREVLQLVAEGKTLKEISATLKISTKTVEFHKNALMNEIGFRTTAELTRYAISRGIVTNS